VVTFGLRLMGDTPSGDGLRLLRLIGDTPEMRELSVAEQRYHSAGNRAARPDAPAIQRAVLLGHPRFAKGKVVLGTCNDLPHQGSTHRSRWRTTSGCPSRMIVSSRGIIGPPQATHVGRSPPLCVGTVLLLTVDIQTPNC